MNSVFRFQIRCSSQIHNIYSQKTEKVIEQEVLKPISNSHNNINFVHNGIPYDPYSYNDGDFYDKKDSYITRVKG